MKNVVLRIGPRKGAGAGYPVRLCWDDGTADWFLDDKGVEGEIAPAALPAHPATQQPVASLAEVLSAGGDPPAALLKQVGRWLCERLEGSGVGGKWKELLAAGGLRHFIQAPPELRDWPWELVRDATALFAGTKHQLFVGRVDFAARPECLTYPLRVLVVVGCGRGASGMAGDTSIAADEEVKAILRAVAGCRHHVDVEIVEKLTAVELSRRYAELKPHVFHFIGHGRHPEKKGDEPFLELWDGEHAPIKWTPAAIANDLAEWRPRLALLNACHSTAPETAVDFSVADAFHDAGAAAVVAMQGPIRGVAAAAFAGRLYQELADLQPLDQALARARHEISAGAELERRDWALPRTTLRAPPDRVLSLTPAADEAARIAKVFKAADPFVDRKAERRACAAPEGGERVLVVRGAPLHGKTFLLLAGLHERRLRGERCHYVDLRGRATTWLGLLRLIVEGEPHNPLLAPFPAAAAAPFRQTLDEWGGRDQHDEATAEAVFDLFRKALAAAAAGTGLTLAIDHMTGQGTIDPAHRDAFVLPKLIDPVAGGQVDGVKLLISAPMAHDEWPRLAERKLKTIDVPAFPVAEFVELATELLTRIEQGMGKPLNWQKVVPFIESTKDLIEGDCSPADMKDLLVRALKLGGKSFS